MKLSPLNAADEEIHSMTGDENGGMNNEFFGPENTNSDISSFNYNYRFSNPFYGQPSYPEFFGRLRNYANQLSYNYRNNAFANQFHSNFYRHSPYQPPYFLQESSFARSSMPARRFDSYPE